jgi:pyruvate, water dikinase
MLNFILRPNSPQDSTDQQAPPKPASAAAANSAPATRPTRVAQDKDHALVLPLSAVDIGDIALVGGKNASLGEMIQQLTAKGINVPLGFATTACAYRHFIQTANLEAKLRHVFAGLDPTDVQSLAHCGQQARSLMLQTPLSAELTAAIAQHYAALCDQYGADIDVAVRSSATAEDLPTASFAGQQETYLNVHGLRAVLEACHKCFASIFTDRAIAYRHERGFDHFDVALSVGVQKMVRSDLASAGVMFSIDTETGFKDTVLITAAYGLGETLVQGSVNPDEYVVFKPTLKTGFRPILDKRLGSKEVKMVYATGGTKLTRNCLVSTSDRQRFALTDDEVLHLARWACLIEDHYTQARGAYTPMDIEWAKDGLTGELFIVQARPETVQFQKAPNVLRTFRLLPSVSAPKPLLTGRAVGEMVGQGRARVIADADQMRVFQSGEVLVTQRTTPDWEPIMKQASAIITDQGGRTCHAAIIARELGIPAIVGCGQATALLKTGQMLTVDCSQGGEGAVYAGALPYEEKTLTLDELPRTRTQVLLNVGNPQAAFHLATLPNDGVGLARLEFIIAKQIQIHPLALINFGELDDHLAQNRIAELTAQYEDKPQFFIDQLAQGIGTIAAAFYPKPVIVRLSDFKSNEYANLLGGRQFEPREENPMLGWRGASRYCDRHFREAFALECLALKRVRDAMGLTNVMLMVPFCRTPEEGQQVLDEMARHGLVRGDNGLQVYIMCEIPSNVLLADQFSQCFDGFSIGSNDLTQLTLGLDRDSALVAARFDERNPAVKALIHQAIATAKRHHRKIGICGQAPSDYPEFTQFLVAEGIDSISFNPDSLLKGIAAIAEAEASLAAPHPN